MDGQRSSYYNISAKIRKSVGDIRNICNKFHMATVGRNAELYDCQVTACQKFFSEQLPDVSKCRPLTEDEIPETMKNYARPLYLYDITGVDARQVIELLVKIINNGDKFTKNKTFYFMLHKNDESKEDEQIVELFKLRANPTKDQPGNGVVFIRPRGKKVFKRKAKNYEQINSALRAYYKKDTKSFAEHIQELFLDNTVDKNDFPQITIEAYMILLFEIARRLVASKEPSELKVQYDMLPIGIAIVWIVKLLEYGEEEICAFRDVFSPGRKFHCFSGSPQVRKESIVNINKSPFVNAEGEKEKLIEKATKELQDTFRRSLKRQCRGGSRKNCLARRRNTTCVRRSPRKLTETVSRVRCSGQD